MASFTCPACGGCFAVARRAAHDSLWCPALDDDHDQGDSPTAAAIAANPPPHTSPPPAAALAAPSLLAVAATSASCAGTVEALIQSTADVLPAPLRFQQQSIFGALSTGGALWPSELVLAEWVGIHLRGPNDGRATSSPPPPRRVIELGCGVAPAAGLCALALGCDVLFSDMPPVLPFVEANIRLNHGAVSDARGQAHLARSTCDTVSLTFGGDALPERAAAMAPFGTILVSDCIFRVDLHDILAATLARLLALEVEGAAASAAAAGTGGTAMVSFVLRDAADLRFFTRACPAHGLCASPVSLKELRLDSVAWRRDGAADQKLEEEVFLYKVSLEHP